MSNLEFVILQTFLTGGTAIITWVLSRKKYKVDVQKSELENVEKAVAIWRRLAEDFGNKVERLAQECQELQLQVETLKKENKALKIALNKFEKRIKDA